MLKKDRVILIICFSCALYFLSLFHHNLTTIAPFDKKCIESIPEEWRNAAMLEIELANIHEKVGASGRRSSIWNTQAGFNQAPIKRRNQKKQLIDDGRLTNKAAVEKLRVNKKYPDCYTAELGKRVIRTFDEVGTRFFPYDLLAKLSTSPKLVDSFISEMRRYNMRPHVISKYINGPTLEIHPRLYMKAFEHASRAYFIETENNSPFVSERGWNGLALRELATEGYIDPKRILRVFAEALSKLNRHQNKIYAAEEIFRLSIIYPNMRDESVQILKEFDSPAAEIFIESLRAISKGDYIGALERYKALSNYGHFRTMPNLVWFFLKTQPDAFTKLKPLLIKQLKKISSVKSYLNYAATNKDSWEDIFEILERGYIRDYSYEWNSHKRKFASKLLCEMSKEDRAFALQVYDSMSVRLANDFYHTEDVIRLFECLEPFISDARPVRAAISRALKTRALIYKKSHISFTDNELSLLHKYLPLSRSFFRGNYTELLGAKQYEALSAIFYFSILNGNDAVNIDMSRALTDELSYSEDASSYFYPLLEKLLNHPRERVRMAAFINSFQLLNNEFYLQKNLVKKMMASIKYGYQGGEKLGNVQLSFIRNIMVSIKFDFKEDVGPLLQEMHKNMPEGPSFRRFVQSVLASQIIRYPSSVSEALLQTGETKAVRIINSIPVSLEAEDYDKVAATLIEILFIAARHGPVEHSLEMHVVKRILADSMTKYPVISESFFRKLEALEQDHSWVESTKSYLWGVLRVAKPPNI